MKIEKCPFCGGEVKIDMLDSENSRNVKIYSAVHCPKCHEWFFKGLSKEKTVAAWNRRAQPENKPLALDELRQMDGEPVWVETLDGTDEPRWEIIVSAGEYGIDLICVLNGVETSDYADFDLYNDTWLAYRNKPVKEEHYEAD